ncbi:hypothetical protein CVO76_17035 [Arthrobacter agilis]|uniref:LysM domain-containing protein n=2 Tax=Arthrobacter agilis TaxID=37921 RepID=A0A2L0UIQ9_9MICC|nr:hypothetical protein CVO76_17035 [Arthrobacter agilis]
MLQQPSPLGRVGGQRPRGPRIRAIRLTTGPDTPTVVCAAYCSALVLHRISCKFTGVTQVTVSTGDSIASPARAPARFRAPLRAGASARTQPPTDEERTMTAQRSKAPLNGTRRKAVGASPRGLNVAVTTAALPAVILSSVALAQPATAAPAPQASTARHLAATVTPVPARSMVPAALVASQVPAQKIAIVTQTVPSSYTIKPGDTIGAISKRYGLSTDAVLKLNRMDARTVIYPGQKIKLTGSTAPTAKPAPAAPAPQSATTYVVKPGDTLGAIAARNGVSLQSLLAANKLSMTSIIYPGQKLGLGGKAPAATPAPAPAPAPAGGTYTVKPGDTLGAIASRTKVGLTALLKANNLSMSSIIHPGQVLKLSGTAPAQPTPPKATPPVVA